MNNITFNARELTLKILSCIYRAEEKYGSYLIAATLCGADSNKVKAFGLDKLSTYGIVDDLSINQVQAVIYYLMHLGFIFRSTDHGNLKLTDKGKQFLKQRPPLSLPTKILEDAKSTLFAKKLFPTHLATLTLWQRGLSVFEIASTRKFKETTIEGHLADLVYHQKITDISRLVSPENEKLIQEVLDKNPDQKFKKIKEQLPATISYGQIKIVLAFQEKLAQKFVPAHDITEI